jgi:Ca2+-binding EF-hand superfamily protein
MGPVGKSKKEDSQCVDDYRSVVRTAAANAKKNVNVFLKESFGPLCTDDSEGRPVLTYDSFEVGYGRIKTATSKLTWKDLNEVFAACDDAGDGKVPVDDFYEFSLRTSSNVLTLALKLRAQILKEHETEDQYRKLFGTIEKSGTDASEEGFRSFVEEEMGHPISESESLALYAVVDSNRDGRVSLDDFLEFLVSQSSMAARALTNGNSDVIVDMRVSSTREEDGELLKQGYTPVQQHNATTKQDLSVGTFGGGQSLWLWWRRQGTAMGRLQAIIDIQLEPSNVCTNLVINGYTCLQKPANGKYIWIRRARNLDEERDALLDVEVTVGRIKNAGTDLIYKSPGVGWSRGDKHLSSGLISVTDYLIWTLPCRPRTLDSYLSRPKAVALSTEGCYDAMTKAIRLGFRHYVPVSEMAPLCESTVDVQAAPDGAPPEYQAHLAPSSFDFTSLFHRHADAKGRMYKGGFTSALTDVGCRLDSSDANRIFYFFDTDSSGFITRETFTYTVVLTQYEVDMHIEEMKKKLSYDNKHLLDDGSGGANGVRKARMLSDVYKMLGSSSNTFMSVQDIQMMGARLNFYLTEEEAHMVEKKIDNTGDGRIEEADFVQFMEMPNVVQHNVAERVREAAVKFKRWISNSGGFAFGAGAAGVAGDKMAKSQAAAEAIWSEFKKFHDKTVGTLFLGYLQPSDLRSIVAEKLKIRLSPYECKLFAMLIAPQGHGQVRREDITAFSARKCRSFGELIAVLERQLFKTVTDVYKNVLNAEAAKDSVRMESALADLSDYSQEINEVVHSVAVSGIEQSNATGNDFQDERSGVATLTQVKEGLEDILQDQHNLEDHQLPNLEEWAMLATLAGCVVVDDGSYGVRTADFVTGLCECVAGPRGGKGMSASSVVAGSGPASQASRSAASSAEEDENLNQVCRTLQRMIREEAAAAAITGSGKFFDFKAPFDLFDTDAGGTLSPSEFKAMLEKLRVIDGISMSQISLLVARFDTKNKGYISLDDFQRFAESEHYGLPTQNVHDVGSDSASGSAHSAAPPAAITRDADCDMLLWHLWRRCCTIEPLDPESLITALERACSEIEMTRDENCVSARELWSLLAELDLRVGLSSADFQRGIASLTKRGRAGEALVDAVALCRCAVRMGRAHVAMEREARVEGERVYHELVTRLQGELQSLGEVSGSAVKGTRRGAAGVQRDVLRFEHVMHRLDDDGDGALTQHEFQIALKRLRAADARKWTDRCVTRLFEEVDPHSMSVLNIRDFAVMVRNGELGRTIPPKVSGGGGVGGDSERKDRRQFSLDDDDDDVDDDDNVFAKVRVVQDHALLKKTYEALSAVVPRTGRSALHVETVCGAVRRFFERSDPSGRGLVSDDRFRTFCRRSGLQDILTLSDVRRLVERLRRRRPSGQDRSAVMVDYEKFCEMLQDTANAVLENGGDRPGGKDFRAEAVLLRLQDAAAASANEGRAFPALCSLLDQRNTGYLLRDELIHVAKMMGTTLTAVEVEMLMGLLPAHGLGDGGNSLAYAELLKLMSDYIPRSALSGDLMQRTPSAATPVNSGMRRSFDFEHTALRPSGALPLYASPRAPTSAPAYGTVDQVSLLAPEGSHVRTPMVHPSSAVAFEPNVVTVAERLRVAQDARARNYGRSSGAGMGSSQSLNLARQCEVLDMDGRGFLPMRSLQALTDGLGVALSSTDIAAIRAMFGSNDADDCVDYKKFCDFVQNASYPTPIVPLAQENIAPPTPGQPMYMSDWTLKRLKAAKAAGQNPRDLFEAIDIERCGLVDVRRFRDVLERIDLLQSDLHIEAAVQDWASLAAKHLIHYDGFCAKLERALNRWTPGQAVPSTPMSAMRGSLDRSFDMHGGSAYGGSSLFGGGLSHPGTPAYGMQSPMGESLRDFQLAHTDAPAPQSASAAGRYRDSDLRSSAESFGGGPEYSGPTRSYY